MFVPNAFTPNGDGLNDTFKAVSGCELEFFRMEIYNRWGEFLWRSLDITTGWDGFYKGEACPGDAYVYKIAYRYEGMPADAMDLVKTGTVVILNK
jgi:gliding motility-associated-like protein